MITKEQFLVRQPSFPELKTTDPYYYDIAVRLEKAARTNKRFAERWPAASISRAALCVTGYIQDIASDAGVWRSFIDEHRNLYGGRTLPFFTVSEDYVDYELNEEDVRFLVWYALAMNTEKLRYTSPMDTDIADIAHEWHRILDEVYDECPTPDGYNIAMGLELDSPDEQRECARLANWLFLHCWLMTPAYSETLSGILAEPGMKDAVNTGELQLRLEQSMAQDPTGPLALYLAEWMALVAEGKRIRKVESKPDPDAPLHPYYEKFVKATCGERVKFIDSYEELNRFFIDVLGWSAGEEHLPQMKSESGFVLLVDPHKGMLLAKNVARCIAHPSNPYYDRKYARRHAIELLTVRGVCPADLLHFIYEGGWLPDAAFPDAPHDFATVADNHDFIARCYLQQYYRGD